MWLLVVVTLLALWFALFVVWVFVCSVNVNCSYLFVLVLLWLFGVVYCFCLLEFGCNCVFGWLVVLFCLLLLWVLFVLVFAGFPVCYV